MAFRRCAVDARRDRPPASVAVRTMRRRVVVRASALAVAAVGTLVALTVYFSTQTVPPCLVSGVPKWRAPTDASLHRFELVVPDRALCFFDQDHDQQLVGYRKLPGIECVRASA